MDNQASAIAYKAHIIVLPFYAQGHINPILQIAKRFASKNIKITVASLASVGSSVHHDGSFSFEPIYDDYKEGGYTGPGGYKGFVQRFDSTAPVNLIQVIMKLEQTEYPVKCLLYDPSLPWAIDIAKQYGLASATFFTMSCTMIASLYPLYHELVNEPLSISVFPLPELPEMRSPYVPSMGCSITGRFPPLIRTLVEQIKNIGKADWVLFNTYYELEQEVVKWMSNLGNVRTVGPTVPSFYLDKRIENDIAHGFNMYKKSDEDYMKWLGSKDVGSVIYVSFGSGSVISLEQMAEIAEALRRSNKNFLWVVRETEQDMLLKNFAMETLVKGLVIPWCSQLEVLDHDSVGCFLTHCGWNSTLEAMSLGVPMVAIPQFLDQTTNAYCVERMWGVGVVSKADNGDNQGFVVAGEILRCIREVMDGGNDIKENAVKWKKLANEAVNEGGSSDLSIDEIITYLVALDHNHSFRNIP